MSPEYVAVTLVSSSRLVRQLHETEHTTTCILPVAPHRFMELSALGRGIAAMV